MEFKIDLYICTVRSNIDLDLVVQVLFWLANLSRALEKQILKTNFAESFRPQLV